MHAPLNPDTRKLFDRAAFEKMKKSAIFINVARGAIVDQEALTWALQENKIAAAALDVLDGEPMREDNPLRQIQDSGKLIITPHIAWAPKETRERLLNGVYENIKKILCYQTVRYHRMHIAETVVNPLRLPEVQGSRRGFLL